ncbi:MAG: nucleotidyltransferase [Gemmataceae bacterium]|nr:nucleotidyltransferase [Gemmataceae bacterium]
MTGPVIAHDLDLAALGRWGCEHVPGSLFWTVSGSHQYGFSSADSDVDLRGCFALPVRQFLGLRPPAETCERAAALGGREVDLVAHEAAKYFRLMVKHGGYVLEQVMSPLVAFGPEFLDQLRPLAARCLTRGCHRHYRGFLQSRRKVFENEVAKKAKTLLYAYRVVLTGIHLLETGELVVHLPTLNDRFRLPFIPELIARKASTEAGTLTDPDVAFHRAQLDAWGRRLDEAYEHSRLPEEVPEDEIDTFLVDLRLGRELSG